MTNREKFSITNEALQHICHAHHLGKIATVEWAGRGMNNPVFIVNNQFVLRFDGLDHTGRSRFYGEKLAYEQLRAHGIPAPEVIALDVSKTLAPTDYIILSKIEGRPVVDDWPDLSPAQHEQVATEAGRYLALMHDITFAGYGKLLESDHERPTSWYAYVMDWLTEYTQEGIVQQVLTPQQAERILAIFKHHKPLLERVAPGRLVHWDYHFENILQQDGHITGIIDFEWALSGDPSFDFRIRDYWDEICPGSRALIYSGYTSQRALHDDHELRISLYRVMMYLDYVVDSADGPELEEGHKELLAALQAVEGI